MPLRPPATGVPATGLNTRPHTTKGLTMDEDLLRHLLAAFPTSESPLRPDLSDDECLVLIQGDGRG